MEENKMPELKEKVVAINRVAKVVKFQMLSKKLFKKLKRI